MVPRPKSEAWMLCALKVQPYQNCHLLEDEPGNDNSPNSLKAQLAAIFNNAEPSAAKQSELVAEGRVDPLQIDMPSFQRFREELEAAVMHARLGL